jgi:hypothetical protein
LQDPVKSSVNGYRAPRNPEIVSFLSLTMLLHVLFVRLEYLLKPGVCELIS